MPPAKYATHAKVLATVTHWISIHEMPNGSNRGPLQVAAKPQGGVSYFQSFDFINGDGYPWCISTIQAAWACAGRPLPYRTAGAYDLGDWAKRVGWTVSSVSLLVPGDPVIFNIGSGHGATFERYDKATNTIHTIDGNVSNGVARRERPLSSVRNLIHVPEKPATVALPVPEPFWVIATSENGHRVLVFSKFASEKTIAGLLPRLIAKYGKAGLTIKRGGIRGS